MDFERWAAGSLSGEVTLRADFHELWAGWSAALVGKLLQRQCRSPPLAIDPRSAHRYGWSIRMPSGVTRPKHRRGRRTGRVSVLGRGGSSIARSIDARCACSAIWPSRSSEICGQRTATLNPHPQRRDRRIAERQVAARGARL